MKNRKLYTRSREVFAFRKQIAYSLRSHTMLTDTWLAEYQRYPVFS